MRNDNDLISPSVKKEDFIFTQVDVIKDEEFQTESIGFFKDALIRFRKNKASIVAFFIIATTIFMAIFGPMMNGYGYKQQHAEFINMPPRIPLLEKLGILDGSKVLTGRAKASLEDTSRFPEGSIKRIMREYTVMGVEMVDVEVDYYKFVGAEEHYFWFGSDYLGRDLWTRLWRGARISLLIAFLSVTVNTFIGLFYGAIAGYYGGVADLVMMRVAELIGGLPLLVVLTMFILYFGTGVFTITMSMVVAGWIGTAGMIRSQFYRYKNREYVLAARTLGVGDWRIILRHIMPNAIGPIITRAMIAVPGAIFTESFLAYIGLGLQAPEPSIGVLLSTGQQSVLQHPFQLFFPAFLISALMIAFNLFSNGLREAFDPTRRGEE